MKYERSLIDDVKYTINLMPETKKELDFLNEYWKKGKHIDVYVDESNSLIIETNK